MRTARCLLVVILAWAVTFCSSVNISGAVIRPAQYARASACVAAAPVSGWYAACAPDNVFIYDIYGSVKRAISRALIENAISDGNAAGAKADAGALLSLTPTRLAFSASGMSLYISLSSSSDSVWRLLLYDVSSGTLSLLSSSSSSPAHASAPLAHHKGQLFAALDGNATDAALAGKVLVFSSSSAGHSSQPAAEWALPEPEGSSSGGGGGVARVFRGLAIDRDSSTLYVATDREVFRALLPDPVSSAAINLNLNPPVFTLIARGSDLRGLSWAAQYGGDGQGGLYMLDNADGESRVLFVPSYTASSTTVPVAPLLYTSSRSSPSPDNGKDGGGEGDDRQWQWRDLVGTADGRLLIATSRGVQQLSDRADSRLDFHSWMHDELAQVTAFARGLILPLSPSLPLGRGDGQPGAGAAAALDGWVLDGDVIPGNVNSAPASPDAAAWAVLLLLMNDFVNGDSTAVLDVRRVLTRYAGLSADGVKPARNADGIFKHWLQPSTGDTHSGWPDEYATLSTMKMVIAAARAAVRYPHDRLIAAAAWEIITRTTNWEAYLQLGSSAMAFKARPDGSSGADESSWDVPFFEGIMFVEQAGVYSNGNGSSNGTAPAPAPAPNATAAVVSEHWFDRALWPTAQYVSAPHLPMTVQHSGVLQPAFISLYPALLSAPYRAQPSWRAQVDSVRWNHAAWTDDNGASFFTVFSAGTSPIGYSADTLAAQGHPGNLTTFTSVLALAAFGESAEAVAGYAAYRAGARQTFLGGASILYRRPVDGSDYTPNAAGLPDVALGVLGLCELMRPGSIDAVLAVPYPALASALARAA